MIWIQNSKLIDTLSLVFHLQHFASNILVDIAVLLHWLQSLKQIFINIIYL